MRVYRGILSNIQFSRALHLGSGRDRVGLGNWLESHDQQVIALDPDQGGIHRNDQDCKLIGDGQRLPFANNTFDLVFSEYVFEHLSHPRLALVEVDRVLRPGGSFVVLVPNPRHYYARIADLTPFWMHLLWFRLQGVESADKDRFPTQYEWGTYSDLHNVEFDWTLEEIHTFPGPTGYTRILPIHVFFVIYDRAVSISPDFHVCYIVHYRKTASV